MEDERVERHEVNFKSDIRKIIQWTLCNDAACDAIKANNKKIRDELDAGVIRAGGKIPCRRNGERRKNV